MIDNNPPDYFFDCMVEKDVRKYLTTRNIRWNINEKDIHIKANKTKKINITLGQKTNEEYSSPDKSSLAITSFFLLHGCFFYILS